MWSAIHDSTIMLVWKGEETLGGVVIGSLERDFTEDMSAYIMKFYVEKELRGLGVAQELLQAFDQEAFRMGAKMSFASSTAGMGEVNEKLYVRLFEQQGYNVLGRVLVKELK